MPRTQHLRVAGDSEKAEPPSLLEAVERGDVLDILRAQRRIIAESLMTATENTRPQFSNELSKLNDRIATEQATRDLADKDRESPATAERTRRGWDQSAI